jgi:anti-repressor protein
MVGSDLDLDWPMPSLRQEGQPPAVTFEGQPVRLVARAGDLWFVLADICQALELTNPTETARCLDDDEKGLSTIETLDGPQELVIVSEPGLYKLIATSRKPVAVRFDRWVRHEVLVSIR